jgi:hypothetical protein
MISDRVVYYDYFENVLEKLKQEVGTHIDLKLKFLKYTPDKETPKLENLGQFQVEPQNKEVIDKHLKEYVYTDENLNAPYKQYQYTYSIGSAIPKNKVIIYKKILADYLY